MISSGRKAAQRRHDDALEGVAVGADAAARRQRDVEVRAAARALADDVDAPAARRVVLVLVQRDREHVRVAQEDRLGAVAVVDVPVDDRDAPDAAHLPARGGSRSPMFEKTQKPIDVARGSAWWPGGRTSA